MIGRRGVPAMMALVTGTAFLAGCATGGAPSTDAPGFPWVTVSDVPQSRGDLKNASRLDLSYAQFQEQSGNLPEAEQAYRRALGEDPKSLDARLGLARIAYRSGRNAEAEKALREILANDPKNPHVLAALGQYLAGEQRWDESLPLLEHAADALSEEPRYRHQYAVVLAWSGSMDRAFDEFVKVYGEAEAHYQIASLHREQGKHRLAETELVQALELRPELAPARRLLEDIRRNRKNRGSHVESDAYAASPIIQTAARLQPGAIRHAGKEDAVSLEGDSPSN